MKKSILALGAAAAVAGFAGVAHAQMYMGPGATVTNQATGIAPMPGGVGHFLFAPYFTTQSDNNTLLSVVNTDTVNGKAVKVRFRGAANSDDVLDFTVFLSPGDVWTASLIQGADGLSHITTPDNSCTLPQNIQDKPFKTVRLQQSLTAEQLAEHTREGYVEFLNMADVAPNTTLFKNIKHKLDKNQKNGVAPCDYDGFGLLTQPGQFADAAAAETAGLRAPTGGLMGGWQIVRLSNISTYSGVHTAAAAVNGAGFPAQGNIVFSPQREETIGRAPLANETADPLLVQGALATQYQDLPDMSSALYGADAGDQADSLSLALALAKRNVLNEFVSTAAGAVVPGRTDWVVSQPTRRYHAAVAYDALSGSLPVVINIPGFDLTVDAIATRDNPFYRYGGPNDGNIYLKKSAFGSIICARGTLTGKDREEAEPGVTFSPNSLPDFCGEVFVLSFNDPKTEASSVLNANLTRQAANVKYNDGSIVQAGWANLTLAPIPGMNGSWMGMPVTGFAATSLLNQAQNGNYGYTLQHRWNDVLPVYPAAAPAL